MKTLHILKSMAGLALLAASLAVVGCKSDGDHTSYSNSSTVAVKPYPLNKCLVSDEALERGKMYTFVRNGQEIKLCCKDCRTDFDKDPAKYLSKLNTSR